MKKIANVYSFKVIVSLVIIFFGVSDIKLVFSLLLFEVSKCYISQGLRIVSRQILTDSADFTESR